MRDGREAAVNSFYIEGRGAAGAAARLLPEEAKHASQVLRLRLGEEIFAVDEAGARFLAVLTEVDRGGCACALREALPDNEPPVRVTVYQGLPKADKLEMIAQKLTELGAARLVPVRMERCVARADERDGERKRERLQKIAREAAKQCKRGRALEVAPPRAWGQLEAEMKGHDLLLVPWEEASGRGLRAARKEFPAARDIGIVIGPEGGMSATEVDALTALGAIPVTLGPRILRTETAAITACALTMLLWGDLG